ncbi:unnamed protein product [Cuscuta epithymum]|uniref:Integrase catalytic domain-containing protein n=1 Tax=Cuscuta epithymum TaxID=186058 RepID=A0AAV0F730_9ASTE|nr:unnamed protein product [Cuscuta epithymum]
MGKHNKLSFSPSHSYTHAPFDIVHSDLWTSPILSSTGHRYYILFLDDFTNFLWIYPLSHKSDAFSTFVHFNTFVQNQFGLSIKTLQCDNGREYNNSLFHTYCSNNGISFRFSCPYTSPQNGKAERKIRSINNITRTLLLHASIPPNFWPHAVLQATYLHNILPSKSLSFASPTLALYHKQPSYSHLRIFGCLCYPHIPTPHKLAARTIPCVFLGFPSQHKGYKCLDLTTGRIIISRHVVFDESIFPFQQPSSQPTQSYDFLHDSISPLILSQILSYGPTPSTSNSTPDTHTAMPSPLSHPHNTPTPTIAHASNIPVPPINPTKQPTHKMTTRSKAGIFRPKPVYNLNSQNVNSLISSPLPISHVDALRDPNWKSAMISEFTALINNKTWELVPRPSNANIIRCMWLFKHKYRSDGSLERHKARLVVNGKSQRPGIDCDDTFSPVVKPATIRTVLSIALSHNWPLHQLDVNNAFLHGFLDETVYMHQPPGFKDPSRPSDVCLLKKSLYGLKQAPRAWYHRFASHATKLGFHHSKVDHSLFIYNHNGATAYLLLYVDDIVLTASSPTLLRTLISQLGAEFSIKDLGHLTFFLGIAVTRRPGCLTLSQQKYATEIIHRAGMASCKPSCTPVDTSSKLSSDDGPPVTDPTLYRSLAGALQYLTFTRPDISYAVQQVCLHMHDPRVPHFDALKRILRYVKGTLDYALHLRPTTTADLVAYSDADWGGCPDTRRSTSGFCVFMGDNLISWSSKRQPTISRSSAEAEYRGVAHVVAELCWLRNLLLELRHPVSKASLVYCDNVSAIYMSQNPVQHQRTKHIEMDIHFVRERVALGHVRVLHVPSRFQYADIFTKGLPRVLFEEFRSSLNIHSTHVQTAGEC